MAHTNTYQRKTSVDIFTEQLKNLFFESNGPIDNVKGAGLFLDWIRKNVVTAQDLRTAWSLLCERLQKKNTVITLGKLPPTVIFEFLKWKPCDISVSSTQYGDRKTQRLQQEDSLDSYLTSRCSLALPEEYVQAIKAAVFPKDQPDVLMSERYELLWQNLVKTVSSILIFD
jgi:hypothetical protein